MMLGFGVSSVNVLILLLALLAQEQRLSYGFYHNYSPFSGRRKNEVKRKTSNSDDQKLHHSIFRPTVTRRGKVSRLSSTNNDDANNKNLKVNGGGERFNNDDGNNDNDRSSNAIFQLLFPNTGENKEEEEEEINNNNDRLNDKSANGYDNNENDSNNFEIKNSTTNNDVDDGTTVMNFEENISAQLVEKRIRRRMGNTRSYARPEAFQKENLKRPISIDDLLPIPVKWYQSFYLTWPARILTFVGSYYAFPYIIKVLIDILDPSLSITTEELDEIIARFVPGISILYSTMIGLTLQTLYTRQRGIQDAVGRECSLLSLVTKNLLSLFAKDRDLLLEAGRCVSEQVVLLVRKSRAEEMMTIVSRDPYVRMVDLIDAEEERMAQRREATFLRKGPLYSNCRDLINQLVEVRSTRLAEEANALLGTQFELLNSLTLLLLLGYAVSVLPSTIANHDGIPTRDVSLLFAILTTIYIQFVGLADDLNEPYLGVYQLRRSSSAVHLLSIRKALTEHPLIRDEINFEN